MAAADTNQQKYNDPAGGNPSTVGNQFSEFYYQKKALIEITKEQKFSQLADVTAMPKHMGKAIKRYHYLPLLDDANINDQGIDAAGVSLDPAKWYVTLPATSVTMADAAGATALAAAINAVGAGVATAAGAVVTVTKTYLAGGTEVQANAIKSLWYEAGVARGSGNMYGSSKDVGTISAKMPVLSETGGRVNRVGFKRKELVGTIEKFGFFDEYTQDMVDFDTDAELQMHIHREMLRAASELTEDALQVDLLTQAGTLRYAGAAMEDSDIDETSIVTYGDLMRINIDLDNNHTPKKTTVITGSRMVDTKTLPAGRVAFIGSELIPTIRAMKDLHGDPAFIPVEKYAAGGTVLNDEIGAVDNTRFVVAQEMQRWEGAGADATGHGDFYQTNGKFNVYPILIVGDGSFTTIGFQTDGKSVKFKIVHKAPGEGQASRDDPYGETGFMSIKWWYGFMALRPERIALIKTAAAM